MLSNTLAVASEAKIGTGTAPEIIPTRSCKPNHRVLPVPAFALVTASGCARGSEALHNRLPIRVAHYGTTTVTECRRRSRLAY